MALERGVKFEWTKNGITYYTHANFVAENEDGIDEKVNAYLEVEKEKDRNATFVRSTKMEMREV
tara:strand:- start:335 stop:526 length:192 start_codon:yes stop_codon:yes gene_type:complete